MRKYPLVPVAIAMIAGIATAHYAAAITTAFWLTALGIALAATGIALPFRKRFTSTLLLALLTLASFTIGGLLGRNADPRYRANHWNTLSANANHTKPHFIALRLTDSPECRERSWRTKVEIRSLDGHPCHGETSLYLRKDSLAATLHYGDQLLIHTHIDTLRRTLYTTSDHYLVTARDSTSLRARSEALRMRLLHRMQRGPMEPRYTGIAAALALGWRGDLDKGIQSQFRDTGILHLLCVSGLHVGLLAVIVGRLMVWVGKERRGRIIRGSVQMAAIWLFALLSGLAPATVRAALMFSLFVLSRMMGRRTPSFNILATAAIAMLFANPMLLFNIGWQLSFSAVAGILLIQPILANQDSQLVKTAYASVAATVATLPVTLATFHLFMPYFLLANVIIVPLSGLMLALSLLYMVFPTSIISWPTELFMRCCDWLTDGISRLPHAVVHVPDLPAWALATLSATIIITFITINRVFSRYQSTK